MFPTIVTIWGFEVHTYGIMLALAFGCALVVMSALAKKEGIPPEAMTDLGLVLLVAGIVGARILYVFTEWQALLEEPLRVLFSRSGFVFFGGLLLAVPSGIWFLRRKGIPVLPAADAAAPGLALAQTVGRLGCFSQGCCYGSPTDCPWGVTFPAGSSSSYRFGLTPVHPTQLYESIGCLILFGLLLLYRPKRAFPGAVLLLYMAGYGVLRFNIEWFRADERGAFLGPLSISQVVSLGLIIVALVLYLKGRRRTTD